MVPAFMIFTVRSFLACLGYLHFFPALYCPALGLVFPTLRPFCYLPLPSPFVPSKYWTPTCSEQVGICLVSLQFLCQEPCLSPVSLEWHRCPGSLPCWGMRKSPVLIAKLIDWGILCYLQECDTFPGDIRAFSCYLQGSLKRLCPLGLRWCYRSETRTILTVFLGKIAVRDVRSQGLCSEK